MKRDKNASQNKAALAILINLAQRRRRARKELRQLRTERAQKPFSRTLQRQVELARERENEAWNAFQASKKAYSETFPFSN